VSIDRRKFGLFAISSLLVTALPPIVVFADGDDSTSHDSKDGKHHELHTSGSKHHEGPSNIQYIQKSWSFSFKSPDIAQVDWAQNFPQGGTANVLIDYKGNWQFAGSFAPNPKQLYPADVTVGFGMKTSFGQIFAVVKTLSTDHNGASWSKTGHNAIVGDLWAQVVKGYDWKWSAHTHEIFPAEPPPQENSSDSTFSNVTDDIAKSMLGPIGFFL
jgi:hypothetical protein